MNAYSYLYHALGCCLRKLDLVIIPKADTPKFIKKDKIISPNQPYKIFRGTDAKDLVSVQVLPALNIHVGSDIELPRKSMTEFLQNMSIQVLKKENDKILLDFEKITNLVKNIIALLRQQNKKSQQINNVNRG